MCMSENRKAKYPGRAVHQCVSYKADDSTVVSRRSEIKSFEQWSSNPFVSSQMFNCPLAVRPLSVRPYIGNRSYIGNRPYIGYIGRISVIYYRYRFWNLWQFPHDVLIMSTQPALLYKRTLSQAGQVYDWWAISYLYYQFLVQFLSKTCTKFEVSACFSSSQWQS